MLRVLCLEGKWDSRQRYPRSVEPLLKLLRADDAIEYRLEPATTREQFGIGLDRWDGRARYDVLYITSHATTQGLELSTASEDLPFDDLRERLAGRCEGRLVHLRRPAYPTGEPSAATGTRRPYSMRSSGASSSSTARG